MYTIKENIMIYLRRNHPDLRVASHPNQRCRWNYATISTMQKGLEYNHRNVMPEEVVIDIDEEERKNAIDALDFLAINSNEKELHYATHDTGGKGFHTHYLFPELLRVKEPGLLKRLLAEWIVGDMKFKWDRQLLGNHLVRMEGGFYEKSYGKTPKYKTLIEDNEFFKGNKVPRIVWQKYNSEVLKIALNKVRPREGIPGKAHTPKCVEYFLSNDFKTHRDGGKRALFVVASWFRKLPEQELYSILSDFNRYNLKTPVLERELIQKINAMKKHSERVVGCKYRHDLLRDIGASHVAEQCEKRNNKVQLNNNGVSCEEKTMIVKRED